ncbi:MAG: nucleotidyltransferase [archaeon]
MIDFEAQKELFKLIGTELRKKTEALVIGGSAMLFYGAKSATYDIDLVFMDKETMAQLKNALLKIGFAEDKAIEIFGHYKTAKIRPSIFKGHGTRFDLFYKEVICFKMTDSMLSRVREVHEFGNLIVKVIAPEDILLLKCATEREKDLVDGAELAKKFKLDWNLVIEESIRQTEVNKPIFPIFLFEFLHNLRDKFEIAIPEKILDGLQKISEDAIADLQKGLKTK